MKSIYELRLFDLIWHHAHVTQPGKIFEASDDQFFKNLDSLYAHANQNGHWSICHNKYYGPFNNHSYQSLADLVDFYSRTDLDTNFIFISSFDFPELNNAKRVNYFYFPEYHAYYYPLYQNYTIQPVQLQKKFVCLNKRGHSFRQALYRAFYNCNLLESSYFSYLCETGHCGQLFDLDTYQQINTELLLWHDRWPELTQWEEPSNPFITVNDNNILNEYQRWSNQRAGNFDWETMPELDPTWVHDTNIYATSFCSVVVETCPDQQTVNLSEKTIRAFCMGHPIILIGAAGTVEYLRKLGFDMFDDLIDHRYDHIHDPVLRTRQCFESIKQLNKLSLSELTKLSQSLIDRRQHNINVVQQLFLSMPQAEFKIAQQLKNLLDIPDRDFYSLYSRYEEWKYSRK